MTVTLSSAPATRVRFGVLGLLCTLVFILYLDRNCISQAAPALKCDLALNDTELGFVLFAFTLGYGLFQVPSGWLGDRLGSRRVLLAIVLWWSAFTALTGPMTTLLPLLAVRFLFGAGEAGALPNVARVVNGWFPLAERSRMQGCITTSMILGGVCAPPVAQSLMDLVGWRWLFVILGSVGLVWAVAFLLWFREHPADHALVNPAERALIEAGKPPRGPQSPVPWRLVAANANVWLLSAVLTSGTFGTWFFYSWYPTYLQNGRGVSAAESSYLTSVVMIGGALGCFLGGGLGDWLPKALGNRRWARCLIGTGGLFFAGVAITGSLFCATPFAAVLCASVAFLCASVQLSAWWTAAAEVAGVHVGTLFGLMNMPSLLVGAGGAQLITGFLVDWLRTQHGASGRAQWDPTLGLIAAVYLCGAVGWLFVDVDKPVECPS